jgi:hypothetical protein
MIHGGTEMKIVLAAVDYFSNVIMHKGGGRMGVLLAYGIFM